ncbi:MAG: sigma factor, partial [Isosphaeraceae bacterium]
MDRESIDQHLSQITTAWTVLGQAHAHVGGPDGTRSPRDLVQEQAQARLLRRYGAAVYRYLLASLRDQDAADELFQEFALRFIRGDFHRADQTKGRFRDFLKTALFRLIVDAQRRRRRVLEAQELAF